MGAFDNKEDFYIFLLIFHHKWMFPYHLKVTMWHISVEGLDQRNIVCEYEVNPLTNEKVIRGKRNFNTNCLRRWTPTRIHQTIS